MVETGLALSILQLVALSLPAFAILLQLIGESDFPYANEAVPVVAASFAAIIGSGVVITGAMSLRTTRSQCGRRWCWSPSGWSDSSPA